MKFLFISFFILYPQVFSVSNPIEIGCSYPKAIEYNSNSYAFCKDYDYVSNYDNSNGLQTTLILHHSQNHATELGVVIVYPGSGPSYVIKTYINSSPLSLQFQSKSLDSTYSSLNSHSYLENTYVCLFTLTVSSLNRAYAAWIDSSKNLNLLYFSAPGIEGISKRIERIVNSKSIDCKGFSNYAQFVCVYKSNIYTENGCIIDIYNSALNSLSNNNLREYGCDSTSIAQKILDINQNTFFVCYTKNNGYVDCLIATQKTNTAYGSKSGDNILKECDTDSDYTKFEVGRIGIYFFVLCTINNFMKYRRFKSDLSTYGEQIDLSSSHSPLAPSSVYLNQYITLLSYSNSNDLGKGYYRAFVTPICNSGISFSGYINGEVTINLDSNIDNKKFDDKKLKFSQLPIRGNFKYTNTYGNLVNVNVNIKYDSNTNFIYTAPPTAGHYKFTYYGTNDEEILSNICEATIIILSCYRSCYTCDQLSSSFSDQRCLLCLTDSEYYPKFDNIHSTIPQNNCYNSRTIDSNYYLDKTTNPYSWKLCHPSCGTCNGGTLNDCLTCASGYFWESIINKICVIPSGNNYGDTTTGYIRPCYSTCDSCSIGGSDTNHNCNNCKVNFYKASDLGNNCYDSLNGYYLPASPTPSSIWEKCSNNCETCNDAGDDKCNSCASGYYFRIPLGSTTQETTPTKCYNQDTIPNGYYLDSDANLFTPCFETCETCSQGKIGDNHNCLTCKSPYIYKYGVNCVDQCPSPTYGFHSKCIASCPIYTVPYNQECVKCREKNPSTPYIYKGECKATIQTRTFVANYIYGILDDCYISCSRCDIGGDKLKMNCLQCDTDYYRLEDNIYQCHQSSEIVEGYVIDSVTSPSLFIACFKTCKSCREKGNKLDHKCTSCKSGYEFDPYNSNNCINHCSNYWYQDIENDSHICVDLCPSDYPYLVINTNECVKTCSSAFNSAPITYYTYEKECLKECPENSIKDILQNKCHSLSDLYDFYSTLGNYLSTNRFPINKYIYGERTYFHLCNTTDAGIEDCDKTAYDLGIGFLDNLNDCFEILKKIYSLNNNTYFYIGLFEFDRDDTTAPQFDYIIFNQYGVQLDNSYCTNVNITISKYFKRNNQESISLAVDVYTKYNYDIVNYIPGNKFFSDICSTFSDNGYDILLNDRYKYFYLENKYYFCENDCTEIIIDISKYRVNCTCPGRKTFIGYNQKDFEKYSKKEQIYHDKYFQFVKCYNLVFSKDSLKKNIGNYVLSIFFITQITICIIFHLKGKKPFFSYLFKSNIIETINSEKFVNNPPKKIDQILQQIKNEEDEKNNIPNDKAGEKYAKKFILNQHYLDDMYGTDSFKLNYYYGNNYPDNNDINNNSPSKYSSPKKFSPSPLRNSDNMDYSLDLKNKKELLKNKIKEEEEIKRKALELEEVEKLERFNEEREKYLKYTYSELYWFVIKKKHKFISLFFRKDIYEIFTYKLSFLILTLSFDFFFCCLYSFNFYLRKLYHMKKHIHFGYEFAIGFLATISTYIIMKIFEYFMEYRTEFRRYEINNERENDKKHSFQQLNRMISKLKIKFIVYFIFCFILNIFIWYFVCAYFEAHSNSLRSFAISIVFDFILSFTFPFLYYAFAVYLQYNAMLKVKYGQYNCSMCLLKL